MSAVWRFPAQFALLVVLVGCGGAAPAQPTATPAAVLATVVPTSAPTSAPTAIPATATPVIEPTPRPTAMVVSAVEGVQELTPTPAPQPDVSAPVDAVVPDVAATSNPCDDTLRPDPLPAPGSQRAADFFRSFRVPLAPAPLYDPRGPKRVGLQAGHWLTDQVPLELGRLGGGAVGGGKQEWQVNLEVAQRTAALLQATGVEVDVLPATIPPRYQANVFLALHADGDAAGQARGFKVARPGFSSVPDVDDRLVSTLNQTYGTDTELPRDDEHISLRMRYYYAFNSRRYCHAVAPGVPQAIIEMGYLTSAADRQLLIGDPDRLARGVADSVHTFLATVP